MAKGKLETLARKRAAARKAKKAEADAAAVADAAAAAAAAIPASDTAVVPTATSAPGISTRRSTYAAVVAGGTSVTVVAASVNAAAVASPSSPAARSFKKHKSSVAAVAPAGIAALAGDASPSAVTTSLKNPEPPTTPVVIRTSRYPSRGIAGRKEVEMADVGNVVATNTTLSGKQKDAIEDNSNEA